MKVKEAVAWRNALADLKISKLKKEDKFLVIKAMCALKKGTADRERVLDEGKERLKPSDWDATVEKSQRYASLTDTDKVLVSATIAAYNRDLEAIVREEDEKEAKIDTYTRIGEDAMALLLEENDTLNLGQIMTIQEAIG